MALRVHLASRSGGFPAAADRHTAVAQTAAPWKLKSQAVLESAKEFGNLSS